MTETFIEQFTNPWNVIYLLSIIISALILWWEYKNPKTKEQSILNYSPDAIAIPVIPVINTGFIFFMLLFLIGRSYHIKKGNIQEDLDL